MFALLVYLLSFRCRSMLLFMDVDVVCRKALPVGHEAREASAQRHPMTTADHVILGFGSGLVLVSTMLITVSTRDLTSWLLAAVLLVWEEYGQKGFNNILGKIRLGEWDRDQETTSHLALQGLRSDTGWERCEGCQPKGEKRTGMPED